MKEKYYINEDSSETRESIALLCIANELAEANRLRRLELRHGSDGLPISCDVEGEDL